jgi:hypothetical protein
MWYISNVKTFNDYRSKYNLGISVVKEVQSELEKWGIY